MEVGGGGGVKGANHQLGFISEFKCCYKLQT